MIPFVFTSSFSNITLTFETPSPIPFGSLLILRFPEVRANIVGFNYSKITPRNSLRSNSTCYAVANISAGLSCTLSADGNWTVSGGFPNQTSLPAGSQIQMIFTDFEYPFSTQSLEGLRLSVTNSDQSGFISSIRPGFPQSALFSIRTQRPNTPAAIIIKSSERRALLSTNITIGILPRAFLPSGSDIQIKFPAAFNFSSSSGNNELTKFHILY
jgi:hypothetical protein